MDFGLGAPIDEGHKENEIASNTARERAKMVTRENRVAVSFFLRRLGLHRSIFDGNEMRVHIGAIGAKTLEALRTS